MKIIVIMTFKMQKEKRMQCLQNIQYMKYFEALEEKGIQCIIVNQIISS